MRIISGRFKGQEVNAPKSGTRPTTDRTKEAIFSHLESWGMLDGTRVLDLFAGTGALGLEALSRGASALVSVESAGPAAALIGKTLASLKRSKAWDSSCSARVVRGRAEKYVDSALGRGDSFDVVFIDPPYAYETADCEALLRALTANHVVADDGVVVLERSGRSDPAQAPQGWYVSQSRKYGETEVFYIEKEPDAAGAETDGKGADDSNASDGGALRRQANKPY
ncbi:MAG: 16S rRNA (guanine(966)-N(2))-methyltransferase RsmD [Bifidobacteriaceae bacterium]|nr:16S rRNA (guanine(966)-N(2))-methyltransferase RsmD [Bifidobacteriaceae bacterium]